MSKSNFAVGDRVDVITVFLSWFILFFVFFSSKTYQQHSQVLWTETGSLFQGTIEAVDTHSYCFDVLYDELVHGKPCREKNIPKSRIKQIKQIDKQASINITQRILKVSYYLINTVVDVRQCLTSIYVTTHYHNILLY